MKTSNPECVLEIPIGVAVDTVHQRVCLRQTRRARFTLGVCRAGAWPSFSTAESRSKILSLHVMVIQANFSRTIPFRQPKYRAATLLGYFPDLVHCPQTRRHIRLTRLWQAIRQWHRARHRARRGRVNATVDRGW